MPNLVIALPRRTDQEFAKRLCPALVDSSAPHTASCETAPLRPFIVVLRQEGVVQILEITSVHDILKALLAAAACDSSVEVVIGPQADAPEFTEVISAGTLKTE